MSPELVPPNEKRLLEILQKTAIIKDNHRETGLLRKKEEPVLSYNRRIALNRYQSLDKKGSEKIQTLPSYITGKLINI